MLFYCIRVSQIYLAATVLIRKPKLQSLWYKKSADKSRLGKTREATADLAQADDENHEMLIFSVQS